MSTVDYGPMIAKAKAAVIKYGRSIKLAKIDTDGHATNPWRPETVATEVSAAYSGLFFPPSQGAALGLNIEINDLLKRASEFVLVATDDDISSYNLVIDGSSRYRIEGMERLKPGDRTILWILGVRQ